MDDTITGIILAGGKSSRFGQDKALLPIGNRTAIAITVELMCALFPRVLISSQNESDYAFLHLPVIPDFYREAGPLAGLHAGLTHSTTAQILLISCDLPLMNRPMIEHLLASPAEHRIVAARAGGHLQFFPGRYDRALLPLLQTMLDRHTVSPAKSRDLSLHALLQQTDGLVLDAEQLPFFRKELYYSINTPAEYDRILRQAAALRLENGGEEI